MSSDRVCVFFLCICFVISFGILLSFQDVLCIFITILQIRKPKGHHTGKRGRLEWYPVFWLQEIMLLTVLWNYKIKKPLLKKHYPVKASPKARVVVQWQSICLVCAWPRVWTLAWNQNRLHNQKEKRKRNYPHTKTLSMPASHSSRSLSYVALNSLAFLWFSTPQYIVWRSPWIKMFQGGVLFEYQQSEGFYEVQLFFGFSLK